MNLAQLRDIPKFSERVAKSAFEICITAMNGPLIEWGQVYLKLYGRINRERTSIPLSLELHFDSPLL